MPATAACLANHEPGDQAGQVSSAGRQFVADAQPKITTPNPIVPPHYRANSTLTCLST